MRKLIELANRLDQLGLTSAANEVDRIIKSSSPGDDFESAGWPNPGTSADIDRGPPKIEYTREGTKITYPNEPGQGETVLEGDVPEGEEPRVGESKVYIVTTDVPYEGSTVEAAFSSREKAQEAIDAQEESWNYTFSIMELDLDQGLDL